MKIDRSKWVPCEFADIRNLMRTIKKINNGELL